MEQRKSNPPQPDGVEKRVFNIEYRETSAEGDAQKRTVTGYAAVFNSPSEDIGFIEIIEPGAFREAIPTSDIRALFNHDPNLILARTASGTLKVQEDDKGLRYEFDIPDTTFGNDFRVMLQRGDVSQSSFSFTVKEQSWETKKKDNGDVEYTRRVKKVERLYDVSPVTYPAYPDTEVALRSLETVKTPETNNQQPTTDNQQPNHRRRLLEAIERAAK